MEIVLFVYNCCVLYIKNLVIYHFVLTFFFFFFEKWSLWCPRTPYVKLDWPQTRLCLQVLGIKLCVTHLVCFNF